MEEDLVKITGLWLILQAVSNSSLILEKGNQWGIKKHLPESNYYTELSLALGQREFFLPLLDEATIDSCWVQNRISSDGIHGVIAWLCEDPPLCSNHFREKGSYRRKSGTEGTIGYCLNLYLCIRLLQEYS